MSSKPIFGPGALRRSAAGRSWQIHDANRLPLRVAAGRAGPFGPIAWITQAKCEFNGLVELSLSELR